jgi:predicted  nucleic acid-binding Zn-ribbon protein
LFNFQTDVDKEASGQAIDLKSANADFKKEQETLNKKISESRQYIPVLERYVALRLDTLQQYGATASKNQTNLSKAADKATTDAKTNAEAAAKAEPSARSQLKSARVALMAINKNKDCSNLDQVDSDVQTAKKTAGATADFAKDARDAVAAATKNIGEITKLTKALTDYTDTFQSIDPPISTIGQSIQFVLNYSGNVTPTWTFVTFKGPNNELFSASGTRTHMLNITLGSPTGSAGTTNAALAQNQLYLLLNNRLPGAVR